jgi:hypothetical protein
LEVKRELNSFRFSSMRWLGFLGNRVNVMPRFFPTFMRTGKQGTSSVDTQAFRSSHRKIVPFSANGYYAS